MTCIQRLQTLYPQAEARAIYHMVMELRFQLSVTDVLLGKDKHLSTDDLKELENIMQRLLQGEPVQYVLGKAEFAGRTFCVQPGVLIPRPETAQLVEMIHAEQSVCRVLDIGTGSGCIAVSLALHGYQVTAMDVSEVALEVAKRNALHQSCKVDFIQDNILHPHTYSQPWDVIVSNPPYICVNEQVAMHRNVLDYEPSLALFVPDEDPLLFYRAIGEFGLKNLVSGGKLYLEINSLYGKEVCQLFTDLGYTQTKIIHDLYNRPRFVTCSLAL